MINISETTMEKVAITVELKKQVSEIDSQFGELACIAETFVGARELLSDLNEDMRDFSSGTKRFQVRIQAILNLLTYANKNLSEVDSVMIGIHKDMFGNIMELNDLVAEKQK